MHGCGKKGYENGKVEPRSSAFYLINDIPYASVKTFSVITTGLGKIRRIAQKLKRLIIRVSEQNIIAHRRDLSNHIMDTLAVPVGQQNAVISAPRLCVQCQKCLTVILHRRCKIAEQECAVITGIAQKEHPLPAQQHNEAARRMTWAGKALNLLAAEIEYLPRSQRLHQSKRQCRDNLLLVQAHKFRPHRG